MNSNSIVETETAISPSSSISIDGSTSQTPNIVESTNSSLNNINDESKAGIAMADPSVIVGMACRVPGAVNTSQLWAILAEKQDLQKKMPEDRFNVDAYYHPQGTNKGTVCSAKCLCSRCKYSRFQTNARYGYFLDQGLDLFDNEFFRISGKEAESMDPQQRLLLEVVYEALENGKSVATSSQSNKLTYVSLVSRYLSRWHSRNSDIGLLWCFHQRLQRDDAQGSGAISQIRSYGHRKCHIVKPGFIFLRPSWSESDCWYGLLLITCLLAPWE